MPKSTASVRVFGDDLDPDRVTELLGTAPTTSYQKGDLVSPKRTDTVRKYGMWSLSVEDAEPDNFEQQVKQLLSKLTQDLTVWHSLSKRFEVDLFCGFFMDNRNQGFSLPVATIAALAERHISPGFDVYAPTEEEEAEYWAKQDARNSAGQSEA